MVFYRATYHHGDARAALAEAGFNLARRGGPRMVTLRAAARDVGITAAAVYRHFTTVEELLTELETRYAADRYRESVPLLDILRPVPADANVVRQLTFEADRRVCNIERRESVADRRVVQRVVRRQRSALNAARISPAKSSGSSQAAKWPPRSTSLK